MLKACFESFKYFLLHILRKLRCYAERLRANFRGLLSSLLNGLIKGLNLHVLSTAAAAASTQLRNLLAWNCFHSAQFLRILRRLKKSTPVTYRKFFHSISFPRRQSCFHCLNTPCEKFSLFCFSLFKSTFFSVCTVSYYHTFSTFFLRFSGHYCILWPTLANPTLKLVRLLNNDASTVFKF